MLPVFGEIYISGLGDDDPERLINEIQRALPQGWKRDLETERRIRSGPSAHNRPTYVFEKTLSETSAALIYLLREVDQFRVTNIVPRRRPQLKFDEYNAILQEFGEQFAEPAASRLGYSYQLTKDQLPIGHWLGANSEAALKRFSATANKGSGSAHPMDFERWAAFIIASHKEAASLDAATLKRWLIEEENWPPEVASNLGVEYEFGRELLRAYQGGE